METLMFDEFVEFRTLIDTKICVKRYDIFAIEETKDKAIVFTGRMTLHINHTYEEALKIAGIKVNNGDQNNND